MSYMGAGNHHDNGNTAGTGAGAFRLNFTETGANTVFSNPGFEDTSFVGAWNNNASEPWWVFLPSC